MAAAIDDFITERVDASPLDVAIEVQVFEVVIDDEGVGLGNVGVCFYVVFDVLDGAPVITKRIEYIVL